jgi:YafQ family addiction module toxin component
MRLQKRHGKYSMSELNRIILELANEKPLPETSYDHPLVGNYADYRECHIAGDWLLIYKIIEGQHSQGAPIPVYIGKRVEYGQYLYIPSLFRQQFLYSPVLLFS